MVTSPRPKLEVIDLAITKKILGPGTIERTNIVTNMAMVSLRFTGMKKGY